MREGRNTGQVLVQLVTAKGRKFEEGYLVEVLRRFPEVRSIHWAVNDTPAEVTNLPTVLLWGEDAIEEEILGLRFRVRPNAFLQTNTEMAEVLYSIARDYAGLTGNETVYDLYCGTGTIGLALAAKALTVWGVEISEESVACAIENAELNGITNAAFFAGNVSLALEELLERAGPPDVVVVDPPRAGLAGKALRRMARLQAPRIVYVSCNPTTLASDLKALREDFGYELRRCTPVDMFPHTPHIESVNLLELRRSRLTRPPEPSVAPHLEAALAPGAPDQVDVREQEPEADRGERGQARDVPLRRQQQRQGQQPDHREPGPADPEAEAVRGGEEQREEEDVRAGRGSRTRPSRGAESDRDALDQARLARDDVARRPTPDRPRVDPRDDEGDQDDPRERLEDLHEQVADHRQRQQLRDVEERAEAGEVGDQREHGETRGERERDADLGEREREPRHGEGEREDDEREHEHVGPEAEVGQHPGAGVPGDEQRDERPRAPRPVSGSVRRQLRPPRSQCLEGVPERRLRGLVVERGVDVRRHDRLDRRRVPVDDSQLALAEWIGERERQLVEEADRLRAHHDDQLRLHDVELPREPRRRLRVVLRAELEAVRAVDRERVDARAAAATSGARCPRGRRTRRPR